MACFDVSVRYWQIDQMRADKLKRLAAGLDATADKDERRIREEQRVDKLRAAAALQLHSLCRDFAQRVNALTSRSKLDLSPPDYDEASFRDPRPNLFQINASGRIVQFAFQSTGPLVSTENFRIPYILEGAVRWFNQEALEAMGVREHLLFFCVEKNNQSWVFQDPKTHQRGRVDEDYLAGVFEDLL